MPRIAAIIQREEYDSFAKLIGHDPEFPKTYDAWLEGMTKENKQRRAHGETINEVVIHPQEFAEWCKARGLDPAFQLLGFCAGALSETGLPSCRKSGIP